MKILKPRQRTLVLWGGALVALAVSMYSDPDKNFAATALGGIDLIQGIWAILLAHIVRKALMDYPEADQQGLFRKAKETSTGAGLALLAKAIVFIALVLVFAPRAHAADVPVGFNTYGPVLKAEQARYWADHPDPSVLAALVEQESCASLKSRMCWNPEARLKSQREEGAGVGQITRAYNPDGSLRFDSLATLTAQYRGDLQGLTWDNVYKRPELQFRALVLMSRDASRPFRTASEWLEFGDAGYNGGVGGVQKERRLCAMTSGCDASKWFGHVERHCLKSRRPLYGGKSACDINREHTYNVFKIRKAKYEPYMKVAK